MIPCGVALLIGLFLYAFLAVLLLVPASLLLFPAFVFRCFEMRESTSAEVCFATKWLSVLFAIV